MTEVEYDLDSFEAAKTEARRTLGEMARESLLGDTPDMISVEIFDDSHRPLLEVRLLLQEIPKQFSPRFRRRTQNRVIRLCLSKRLRGFADVSQVSNFSTPRRRQDIA
jgi:hypothetical protein